MSGSRSALIVASHEYEDAGLRRLRAPARDAEELSRVLRDQSIGDFDLRMIINEPAHVVNEAVEEFFADRSADDLLFVYFSSHGVKDENGDLHFATTNTKLHRLGSTAVSADFVNRHMNRSRSRRIILLLDCCYAGAFARGMAPRSGKDLHIQEQLGGRGRAVITASSAMEYAFEGDELSETEEAGTSVFTSALVHGLESGEADRDQDGWVSLDELYDHVYEAVRAATPHQTPGKWTFGVHGDLYIARRGRPVDTPAPLPPELLDAIDHPMAGIRAGAVQELGGLLAAKHAGQALAARLALQRLTDDDSRTVSAAAAAALARRPQQDMQPPTPVLPIATPQPAPTPRIPTARAGYPPVGAIPPIGVRPSLAHVISALSFIGAALLIARLYPVYSTTYYDAEISMEGRIWLSPYSMIMAALITASGAGMLVPRWARLAAGMLLGLTSVPVYALFEDIASILEILAEGGKIGPGLPLSMGSEVALLLAAGLALRTVKPQISPRKPRGVLEWCAVAIGCVAAWVQTYSALLPSSFAASTEVTVTVLLGFAFVAWVRRHGNWVTVPTGFIIVGFVATHSWQRVNDSYVLAGFADAALTLAAAASSIWVRPRRVGLAVMTGWIAYSGAHLVQRSQFEYRASGLSALLFGATLIALSAVCVGLAVQTATRPLTTDEDS